MPSETKALGRFFLIACIPPWIGWSLLRFGAVPSTGLWQLLYLTGWSASVAGLTATYLEDGADGLRRLLRAAVRVAVPVRWWLFVLFVPILAVTVAALLYVALSGNAVGFNAAAVLTLVAPSSLATFFLGPFGEEFGWRGYLLPRLTRKVSVVSAVLIVGAIWATWHWPLLYHSFVASPAREFVTIIVGVTYMSIVIGTVYLRTGSLLLAMLLHWSINGMRDIADRVFPGLPGGDDHLLQWCGVGANLLVAGLTIPALLVAGKVRSHSLAHRA